MEKLSRKKSLDPVQEALRSHKDIWNAETSQLIGQLIALKRGVNGRGDRSTGIPPSSIKNPLPSEVSSHLSEVITSFNKVIDHAKAITEEQRQYSEHRQQKMSCEHQDLIKLADGLTEAGLVLLASWWGSRLKARLKFFKLEPEKRKQRWQSLATATNLEKELKQFETIILNQKDISASFSALHSFLFSFKNFLAAIKTLQDLDLKDSSEQGIVTEPSSSEESSMETPSDSEPVISEEAQLLEQFSKIKEEYVLVDYIIENLVAEKLTDPEKAAILEANTLFSKQFNNAEVLINKPEKKDEALLVIKQTIELYHKLLEATQTLYTGISSFKEVKLSSEDFTKQANSLNNWLKKLQLSTNPDNNDLLKLEILQYSQDLRNKLDKSMNQLENIHSNIIEINKSVLACVAVLQSLIYKMILLYKKSILELKRHDQDTKKNIFRTIQREEIGEIEKEFRIIEGLAAELKV